VATGRWGFVRWPVFIADGASKADIGDVAD